MKSTGVDMLLGMGVNSDVLNYEIKMYDQFKDQPMELVSQLQGLSVDEACRAIFAYLAEHVRYKLDPEGKQYIKSPARLLKDGNGDCKSLTMFLCCCLHCLRIDHIFRFVNFDGGRQYSHVYAVAIDERGNEIVLDACETDNLGFPVYNYARPFAKKRDFRYYE